MRRVSIVCLMLIARLVSAKSHASARPATTDGITRTPENDEKTKRWLKSMRKHRLGRGMWISPEDRPGPRQSPLAPTLVRRDPV